MTIKHRPGPRTDSAMPLWNQRGCQHHALPDVILYIGHYDDVVI